MISIPLAPFPPSSTALTAAWPSLAAWGIRVCAASNEDIPFLRLLYGDLRKDELDQSGLPETMRQAFLDSQFSLQHHHFTSHYATSDFLLLKHADRPIGRYYLLRKQPYFLIVDIGLTQSFRRRGIGSALIDETKSLAAESGAMGIDLHVNEHNTEARRLYERLEFVETGREGSHLCMRWSGTNVRAS
jgi:ribosomal protein S18 acetylase RimI-like enzyme